jgi:hypothetical protein
MQRKRFESLLSIAHDLRPSRTMHHSTMSDKLEASRCVEFTGLKSTPHLKATCGTRGRRPRVRWCSLLRRRGAEVITMVVYFLHTLSTRGLTPLTESGALQILSISLPVFTRTQSECLDAPCLRLQYVREHIARVFLCMLS